MSDYKALQTAIENKKGLVNTNSKLDNIAKTNLNTFSFTGDSITFMNGSGRNVDTTGRGYIDVANMLLGHKMNVVLNDGVSGERTDQILARLDVSLSVDSRFFHVLAGANDVAQDVEANIIISNLTEIYDSVLSTGKILIIGTITPLDTYVDELSTITSVNKFIRQYAISNKGVILTDYFKNMADAQNGFVAKTDATYDGLHPSIYGGFLMGQALKDAVGDYLYDIDFLEFSEDENIAHNPMLLGSGTIADGWFLTGTNTPSLVLSDEYSNNNSQKISIVNIDDSATFTKSVSTGFSVGDNVYGAIKFVSELTSVKNLGLTIAFYNGGSLISQAWDIFIPTSQQLEYNVNNFEGVLVTRDVEIPENTTSIFFTVNIKGVGDIYLELPTIVKVS